MKKTWILLITSILLCFSTISCSSNKVQAQEEFLIDDRDLSPEEKAELLKKQKEFYLLNINWTKDSSKNVDVTYGFVRLRAKKNLGTFNIAVVNSDGKTIPALSTANEYVTSACYLKAGNKIVKLNQDSSVKSYARKTESGMQIAYVVDKTAVVVLDFDCFSSNPKLKDIDTIKVTAAVKNIGKKKETFEIKFILDTVLGETDRHHFYSSDAQPVKNEIEYRNPGSNDWFVSQNAAAAMVFNFAGLEATKANIVALANFSTLDAKSWKPDLINYRAFDTVLSYNNSAVGILWNPQKVAINDTFSEVFYITLSDEDGRIKENPLAQAIKNAEEEKKAGAEKKSDQKESVTTKENVNTPEVKTPVTETKKEDEEKTVTNPSVTEPEEKVSQEKTEIPSYKLSRDYIQELLDRIDALDENEEVNKEELNELNKELDTILEMMRK